MGVSASLLMAAAFFIGAFVNPPWMLSAAPSFSASAKTSIALTFLAVAISIAIYGRQGLESRESEARLSVLIKKGRGSVEARNQAYIAKGLTRKAGTSLDAYLDNVHLWLSESHDVSPTVLWVDDDQIRILWERRALERVGIEVIWVPDSQSAFQMLQEVSVDLVVSDMSRSDEKRAGLTLLEAIRDSTGEKWRGVPFLVYSSSATTEQKRNVFKRLGDGQMCDPDELLMGVFDILLRPKGKFRRGVSRRVRSVFGGTE